MKHIESTKAAHEHAVSIQESSRLIFNGEFFVVPNRAGKLENYAQYVQKRIDRLAQFNGIELTPNDEIVEVWIVNEDTDNLVDHGVRVIDEWVRPICGLVPLKLIKKMKEGETIGIVMPCNKNKLLYCYLTAAQKKYRYKNFGNFEDALLVAAGW